MFNRNARIPARSLPAKLAAYDVTVLAPVRGGAAENLGRTATYRVMAAGRGDAFRQAADKLRHEYRLAPSYTVLLSKVREVKPVLSF